MMRMCARVMQCIYHHPAAPSVRCGSALGGKSTFLKLRVEKKLRLITITCGNPSCVSD